MTKFRIFNKEENANEVILRLVDEGEEIRLVRCNKDGFYSPCDWLLGIDKASGSLIRYPDCQVPGLTLNLSGQISEHFVTSFGTFSDQVEK